MTVYGRSSWWCFLLVSSLLWAMLLLSIGSQTSFAEDSVASESWQITYRGSLVPRKEEDGNRPQPFTLQLIVSKSAPQDWRLDWVLQEAGRGTWPWPSQFGTFTWQETAMPAAVKLAELQSYGPSLLHPHDERLSTVKFPALLLPGGSQLKAGQSWQQGKNKYQVTGTAKISGHACWQVTVANSYGLQKTLWVEKGRPIVLGADSRVVLGQGKEHRLQFALTEQRSLTAKEQQHIRKGFDSLGKLREQLQIKPGSKQYVWSDEQLKALRSALPQIRRDLRETPLLQVAQLATLDASDQKDRKVTIAAMSKQTLGKKISTLPLRNLKGEPFSEDGLKDAVVVLHFWEYRDKPLEAPYGQVGYLDFLHQKYRKQGLKVYGVAADLRLGDPEQRPAAIRGVKKLVEFMNLSYPVMVDSTGYLKQLGDPRAADSKLPLFLVLDRSSQVIHYHVGYYEVQRDRGLETLDKVVKQALGKSP